MERRWVQKHLWSTRRSSVVYWWIQKYLCLQNNIQYILANGTELSLRALVFNKCTEWELCRDTQFLSVSFTSDWLQTVEACTYAYFHILLRPRINKNLSQLRNTVAVCWCYIIAQFQLSSIHHSLLRRVYREQVRPQEAKVHKWSLNKTQREQRKRNCYDWQLSPN